MNFTGLSLPAMIGLAASCAAALALLHFLRARPREVRVVTTLFWARVKEGRRRRTLIHRFRHPLTYALLLLIALLFCLALGKPEGLHSPRERVHAVFILDGSPSMTVRDGEDGSSRFERAAGRAMERAKRLSLDDRAAVILADPRPRLVLPFEDPPALMRKRLLLDLENDRPAARGAALHLARSLVEGRANPWIVLFTDRPLERGEHPPPDATAPGEEVILVGNRISNAALTSALYEPHDGDPFLGRILVRAENFDDRAREIRLKISDGGGALLLNRTAVLEGGAAHTFSLEGLAPEAGWLDIRLEPADALEADNHLRLRLPQRSPIRIRAVVDLPGALLAALTSSPRFRLVEEGEDRDIDMVPEAAKESVERPSIVVFNAGPGAPAGAPVETAGLDPWTRDLDFEGAACGTGGIVPGTISPVITAGGAVLAARGSFNERPCLLLGSGLLAQDCSAWKRGAFAVFLSLALQDLAGFEADPIVLPPDRLVRDPLWPSRANAKGPVVVAPGGAQTSDLRSEFQSDEREPTPSRRAPPAPFEILLILAGIGLLAEMMLHARGRIS